jgi:hypothetical protein
MRSYAWKYGTAARPFPQLSTARNFRLTHYLNSISLDSQAARSRDSSPGIRAEIAALEMVLRSIGADDKDEGPPERGLDTRV